MQLSSVLRRRRTSIAGWLALLVVVSTLVVVALRADGYQAHRADLNDGGIWVTNSRDGFFGRVNKPIGQLDGAVFADLDTQLDVAQQGAAVLGLNVSGGRVAPIDPATVSQPEGEVATLPGDGLLALGGGTAAALDPEEGELWAVLVDPAAGVPSVGALDVQAPPGAEVGAGATMAVSTTGEVLVVSTDDDTLTRLTVTDQGLTAQPGVDLGADLGVDLGPSTTVTAVGDTAVVLDAETGDLVVVAADGAVTSLEVPPGAVLQHSGAASGSVLLGTTDRLLEVDLASGEERTLADGVAGRASAPVRLGACQYGAWSGGDGWVATRCGEDAGPLVNQLGTNATDLVFRVNRGEILLNDRADGAVWDIDSDEPARLDNWEAFQNKVVDEDDRDQDEQDEAGDRRPPEAKDDDLGARPGRTTVLHPLDNDTAPLGRLLAIRSVQDVAGSQAEVTIAPDGQSVQVRLPEGAGVTTFEYYIDDGREVSAHARVTVRPRTPTVNEPPRLREGFEPRLWTVPAGGTLDVPVLPDWRDPADGDPLSLATADAVGGERSGAQARTTTGGRIRVSAPAEAGLLTVRYEVADGVGESAQETLKIEVQSPTARQAVAAVAEPDVVAGETGTPITIRPLANDLPGSDPVSTDATLELAGKVAQVGGAQVSTDLVEGTLTLRADRPDTYFLDYDARYGNAPFAEGRIRVDVRAPQRPPEQPVAMPDTATVHGQAATLVDVLANDIDPAGGLLVVQDAEQTGGPELDRQLDVAVVDGRWLRVSAAQGTLRPNPQVLRYTISNGARSGVEGEVVVTQRPEPADASPVTEVDRVTVRAGGTASVPVLDNDFSPTGDELGLVATVPGETSGQLALVPPGDEDVPTGEAFVTGRFVRYVAPGVVEDSETFTAEYVATSSSGETSPGRLEVTVVPETRPNRDPEPPMLEGRTVAGDTVTLKLPGSGVDPDGDPVTLTGVTSAPQYGRLVSYGANSLEYQAYPGSVGTDEFSYTVTDTYGATASGTARVAVVPPGMPQPPLAVDDSLTVEAGRTATVHVLSNDHVAAGDRVTVSLVDPPEGVRLTSPVGPVEIDAPPEVDGRNREVVYRITNGLDSSQATLTLRTVESHNNPPVVLDAFGETAAGNRLTVDVLATAYDPDGRRRDLRVTDVYAPSGTASSVRGGSVTVERGDQPRVVPFRVVDADGGATTASLFVPPTGSGPPYARPGASIELDPGESRTFDVDDYVVDPAGGPVQLTLRSRIWSSPGGEVSADVTSGSRFEVTGAGGYAGPGAVVMEVTTGESVDDPDGVKAVVSVPVQVGVDRPILRCPQEPLPIAQGQTLDIDVAALCHVWTPDGRTGGLAFDADWQESSPGLAIVEPSGASISVAADADVDPGTQGTLSVASAGGDPATIELEVIRAPSPTMAPVRVADLRAGESRTIDLAPYLSSGVPDPDPSILDVSALTSLDVAIEREGDTSVRITAGERVDGRAEFAVVMSDVTGDPGPERRAEGRIVLDVLDVPDAPTAPVPGRTVRSQEAVLSWQAPEANGAPIDSYELRSSPGGDVRTCATTTCTVTGLENGQAFTFEVRAHNAVGWSPWSRTSARTTPDAKPGAVGPVQMVSRGDGTLTLRWAPPTTQTSDIESYQVFFAGRESDTATPRVTVTGLDNNREYAFTVRAVNALAAGPPRTSEKFQSIGDPGSPRAPTITDQRTGSDQGAVTLSWSPVDPNGPGDVRYTVLRNDAELPACRNLRVTSCDNSGIEYDGSSYRYQVRATNEGGAGRSATGPVSTWKAVGEPAPWQDWSLTPNGNDRQAAARFTVPRSRGARSTVRIYVDGAVTRTFEATGPRDEVITVPDNDAAHTAALEVCNEAGACSRSTDKSVQAYGPLRSEHIIEVQPLVQGTEVRWRITVDTNGDSAQVRVTSNRGRAETLAVDGVDVNTVLTTYRDIGYSTNETVTVTLSDTSPARGPVSTQATSPATADPPPPTVSVQRGSRCSDRTNNPSCNTGAGGIDCVHASCGRVQITTSNFTTSRATCRIYDNVDGQWSTRTIDTNRSVEPGSYFGYPQRSVWAICDGTESNHYNWPNS